MTELPKPEVIITHESDLDGLTAGCLLQRLATHLFKTSIPLEACHYSTFRQREMKEKTAWITDFSFEARVDKPGYVVIDHHTTDVPPKHALLIHDLNQSAGSLCYALCREHGLTTPKLDRLVHLNNVSDMFLEEDPDFILSGDYANLVKHYGFWNLFALVEGDLEKLIDHKLLEVMAVKRQLEDPLGLEWSRHHVQAITAEVGYVETVVGNTNLIVHKLLEEKTTPYPILLTLFRRSNGAIIVSLRSKNGEALKVAERLQGGGHANACGATLPRSVKSIPDAVVYLKQTLSPAQKTEPIQNLGAIFDGLK